MTEGEALSSAIGISDSLDLGQVGDNEHIARFLYFPQMFDSNMNLTPAAFPVDELVQDRGKSTSTTRVEMAVALGLSLRVMCHERQNVAGGREAKGHAVSSVKDVRKIPHSSAIGTRVFEVAADPILFLGSMDETHSKVFAPTKALARGCRDLLIEAFSDREFY